MVHCCAPHTSSFGRWEPTRQPQSSRAGCVSSASETLPRGPRPATRENPAGLTNRELEVLPPLAEGLRNAEIAAARLGVIAAEADPGLVVK